MVDRRLVGNCWAVAAAGNLSFVLVDSPRFVLVGIQSFVAAGIQSFEVVDIQSFEPVIAAAAVVAAFVLASSLISFSVLSEES